MKVRRVLLCVLASIAAVLFAHQAAAAAPGLAFKSFSQCSGCPVMIAIPPGAFLMGSEPDELVREYLHADDVTNERPRHAVRIGTWFSIGRTEVTRAQFAAFVKATGYEVATGCEVWDPERGTHYDAERGWEDAGFPQSVDDPVVCVSWTDAMRYARWLSGVTGAYYRLPSESEWEYAARAGTSSARYWGEGRREACDHENVFDWTGVNDTIGEPSTDTSFPCDDGFVFTAPVGSFAPNPWGLHDMLGNAAEWVEDCAAGAYDDLLEDGVRKLRPVDERPNSWDCMYRLIRGGGWGTAPWVTRAADRWEAWSEYRSAGVGFRVVKAGPLPLDLLWALPPGDEAASPAPTRHRRITGKSGG
jgi:formylglycine-generating enzyme required for sulfatase activity